ncbi:MAG: response regulator [Paracoccaceae bacterium]
MPHLADLSVIYLEDEVLIALHGEDMLREIGFGRVAIAFDETEAHALTEAERFDIGVLDLNLGRGRDSLAIARKLKERGTRLVFCSGYASRDPAFAGFDAPVLTKPITPGELRRAIEAVAA